MHSSNRELPSRYSGIKHALILPQQLPLLGSTHHTQSPPSSAVKNFPHWFCMPVMADALCGEHGWGVPWRNVFVFSLPVANALWVKMEKRDEVRGSEGAGGGGGGKET